MSKRRRTTAITKATRPVVQPAAVFTAAQVQALLEQRDTMVGPITPLPRQPALPFGPGTPVFPAPLNPPRDDGSGRPEPRIYQYPASVNLPGITDKLVPWKVLRDASEVPLVRDCIRIRKNRIASMQWDIVVSKRALQQSETASPGMSAVVLQQALRDKLDPEVGRLVQFWKRPDPQQDESFVEWCGKALEEHHVLDALAIYPYRNRGGDKILGLRILDGSTIKPLLDTETGGRPAPPYPAYQQILWGFPRGEFVADTNGAGEVVNPYPSDRLIYKRREVRTITPYGFSSVEQALVDVDLYLRRIEWDKAQYTDGVQPAGWIKNTGLESWTPQQILDYNAAFNDMYAGQTLSRMRYHLLPPGMEPMESADIAEKYKPDYHMHLVKLVAMHFDTTIAELGFTEAKGLGSAGYHEGQENVQDRKASNPDIKWLQAILTEISITHLGMPPELEFRFLGLDADEEAAADDVVDKQMSSGRITRNEAREQMGRPPFKFAEADMPVLQTARGLVFIEDSSLIAPSGEEVTPPQAVPTHAPPEGKNSAPTTSDAADVETDAVPGGDAAKKMEYASYRKWLRNGNAPGRAFVFHTLTPEDVTALDPEMSCRGSRVAFTADALKGGGGGDPKARPGIGRGGIRTSG